jgi:4-amino-4-deoxy-L-arabinose transferase-like glycosyltransferase
LIGLAAAAAITALYVYGCGSFMLSEPDEARYAEIAREMLVLGDWVTPHLNFVKYFEKPPLVYWATAAAFAGFGISEFTAHLPSLLSGLATIALTVWLAANMYGSSAAVILLPILALGPLFGICAQVLTLDMSLTFWLTLAMVDVWLGWCSNPSGNTIGPPARAHPATPRFFSAPQTWYRLTYLATAVAILVKGPVAAILVGGVALLFLLPHGGWRALRPALDGTGFALALAVALPWFVLVSWRNPEFLHFFVVDQHLARYLWTNEHSEPVWFFLPLIPVALAPWGLLLLLDPPVLRDALAPPTWSPATRLLAIWAAVTVVFFSLSTSKLLTYILPAIPPLSVLAARAIELGLAHGRRAGLWRIGRLFLVAGPIASLCGAVLPFLVHHWRMPVVAPRLVVGGLVLAATGWVLGRLARYDRPYAALGALALGWFTLFIVVVSGRGAANDYSSLGVAARAAMGPDDRLAMYNHYTEGITYYAERRTIMVGLVGELKFGSQQGDQSAYFWSLNDLRREWTGPRRLFLVINRWELVTFSPPLAPQPIELASKDEKVLLVNH